MKSLKSIFISAICVASHATYAQGVEVLSTPYVDTPTLPIKAAVSAATSGMPVLRNWDVLPEDTTIRGVLIRWANIGGWVFMPAHWTVKSDLPVSGGSSFYGDFKTAVRGLISSSEMTDLPLQPCFYSNGVLRVVLKTEVCDRSSIASGQSR